MATGIDVLADVLAELSTTYCSPESYAVVAALIQENKQLRIKANSWDELLSAREVSALDSEDCEWKKLARRGALIEAIKACRTAHGFSLRESKDCVDGYISRIKGA